MAQSINNGASGPSDDRADAMEARMNFHVAAPKIPPRILCIGMPVRDLTFRIQELPERGELGVFPPQPASDIDRDHAAKIM